MLWDTNEHARTDGQYEVALSLFFVENETRLERKDSRFSRPLDPNPFHLICCLSQAGRVSDQDREPTDI